MDPTYPLVPIANFIACALVVIPLIHLVTRSWNTGVYVFALWTFLSSLSYAVNTIVWANDDKDRAPVWCDISSHLQILVNIGRPACSLIITRRLYKITRLQGAILSKRQKRIELSIELAFCVGFPFVIAGLYYIVQGVRYQILEEMGCSNAVSGSGVSIILISSWTILFPLISLVFYTPRIVHTFYRHRREMNEYLGSSDEGLSQSHFNRMLALGCFDILITLPIVIILLVVDIFASAHFEFYQGWTYIHTEWEAALVPKSEWSATIWDRFLLRWDEWINPFFALVFFILFGLTPEARDGYRRLFRFLIKPLGVKSTAGTAEILPDAIFKDGKDLNETVTSNTSSDTRSDVTI